MLFRSLSIFCIVLALNGCASRSEKIAATCTNYGFTPGTAAFMSCVDSENARINAIAGALMGYGSTMTQQQQQYDIQRNQQMQQLGPKGYCINKPIGNGQYMTQCY
ncbi:hypothetical protein [Magnetospirillum sp. ME-1]|uniref:hypothetical protein n=1 Tax=Magnetospirillum sp. ME-1 TaxID=1639348 RepID=UPI0011AE4B1A|nr:hypothetical protein [Magnetospirillum sp. ME-1]